jgi:hypothetical protein
MIPGMLFPVRAEASRPLAEVYDRLSDCRNEAVWNSQVSSAELVSGEPLSKGSQFRTINRGAAYRATISVYERPDRLEFDVVGGPMDIKARYRLHETDGRTYVEGELEFLPKRLQRLTMPLGRRFIQRDLEKQYRSFGAFCDSA